MSIKSLIERQRIRFHLLKVEMRLRAKPLPLDEGLKAQRLKNLDHLRQYWLAGGFPINTDFPGRRVPYFKDARGTLCAVGYLMQRSGSGALAAHVAGANNHVYINDIQGGPALEWIKRSGLTQEEAAQIQPEYGWHPAQPVKAPDPLTDLVMDIPTTIPSDVYSPWPEVAVWALVLFLLIQWLNWRHWIFASLGQAAVALSLALGVVFLTLP